MKASELLVNYMHRLGCNKWYHNGQDRLFCTCNESLRTLSNSKWHIILFFGFFLLAKDYTSTSSLLTVLLGKAWMISVMIMAYFYEVMNRSHCIYCDLIFMLLNYLQLWVWLHELCIFKISQRLQWCKLQINWGTHHWAMDHYPNVIKNFCTCLPKRCLYSKLLLLAVMQG